MNLIEIVKEINQIAVDAGEVIMEIYEDESQFEVSLKSDDSPLTKADRAANQIICDRLIKLTPDIPIISEENKEIPYGQRKDFEMAWLVDPVDGTKEFIKRNGEFTVNIALISQQEIVLGVVYVPALEALFWAVKDEGAFKLDLKTKGFTERLCSPSFGMNDRGLKVVCSRSHLNEDTANFIDQLNQPEKVAKGSSLKFLVLAEGGAHLYPRLAPTMEWDTGAAQIILEEAGGKVINNETNERLKYNKENLRNPHFIAYGEVK
jgi:3'(2'), 5'-bisphosphate nucleotidase